MGNKNSTNIFCMMWSVMLYTWMFAGFGTFLVLLIPINKINIKANSIYIYVSLRTTTKCTTSHCEGYIVSATHGLMSGAACCDKLATDT